FSELREHGKTKATQTLLQELQKILQTMHLHVNFVRAAAPTGSAAFNIRFNASTIHRLIHWLNPRFFRELKQNDKSLARFQAFMQGTQLVILDEISMVGRQFMGKIDSRLRQAKAGRNPLDRDLGGISCVCVGDTGQCEAISDQQLYDGRTHPNTIDEPSAAKVIFSNKGLGIYSSFDKVVILTTCHRLQTIENPTNDKDRAFNDRADQFLQILHKIRDLNLSFDDYFWLCKRKKSRLNPDERMLFEDAPVIMDLRRISTTNPENNCDFYNKLVLRSHARKHHLPVISFDAVHEGTTQEDGLEIDERHFNDLPANLEVCYDARVILIANLAVEHGLMNGTQGKIKGIVYGPGCHPNHPDPLCCLPKYLIIDFPQYAGPCFWPDIDTHPERRTWVPLLPISIDDAGQQSISRTQ
ncbi:MAG TPA: hypothetical protein EYO32_14995, partial [Rhodospirillales bacterium]|nr:hypothetical protein [Rhodospirillales bacterium]